MRTSRLSVGWLFTTVIAGAVLAGAGWGATVRGATPTQTPTPTETPRASTVIDAVSPTEWLTRPA